MYYHSYISVRCLRPRHRYRSSLLAPCANPPRPVKRLSCSENWGFTPAPSRWNISRSVALAESGWTLRTYKYLRNRGPIERNAGMFPRPRHGLCGTGKLLKEELDGSFAHQCREYRSRYASFHFSFVTHHVSWCG